MFTLCRAFSFTVRKALRNRAMGSRTMENAWSTLSSTSAVPTLPNMLQLSPICCGLCGLPNGSVLVGEELRS